MFQVELGGPLVLAQMFQFESGRGLSICNLFRQARNKAGLPKELVLYLRDMTTLREF